MNDRQAWMDGEPSLEDLLADPVMDAILRRDGLTRGDVRRAAAVAVQALDRKLRAPCEAA